MDKALAALQTFVHTIQNTGGLIEFEDGTYGCMGDPEWIDLGDAVLTAKAVLLENGVDVQLDITKSEES